jgi:hypothetical protein
MDQTVSQLEWKKGIAELLILSLVERIQAVQGRHANGALRSPTGKSWREIGAALGQIVKSWDRGR